MSDLLAQMPQLPAGALETWLLAAMAAATMVGLGIRLFVRKPPLEAEFVSKAEFGAFRASVEKDLGSLRDRIDSRHLGTLEALDRLHADLLSDAERRVASIHGRLNEVQSGLARVDERTRGKH